MTNELPPNEDAETAEPEAEMVADFPPDLNPPAPVDEKNRRLNLINRRSTAYLLESTAFLFLVYPIFWALFLHLGLESVEGESSSDHSAFSWRIDASYIPFTIYWLIRDLIGTSAWAKRLVGLELRSSNDKPLSAGRKVLRNVTLLIPLVALVEFFAAYRGNHRMMRYGDRWAKTYVTVIDPSTLRGTYQGKMVLALILNCAVAFYATPKVTNFYYAKFQGIPTSVSDAAVKTIKSDLGYTIDLPETLKKEDRPFQNTPNLSAQESTLYIGGQDGNFLIRVFELKVDPQSVGGASAIKDSMLGEFSRPPFANVKHETTTVDGRLEVIWSGLKTEEGQAYPVRGKVLFTNGKRFYWAMGLWRQDTSEPSWIGKALDSFALTFPPQAAAPPSSTLDAEDTAFLAAYSGLVDKICACQDFTCTGTFAKQVAPLAKKQAEKYPNPTPEAVPQELRMKFVKERARFKRCLKALEDKKAKAQ